MEIVKHIYALVFVIFRRFWRNVLSIFNLCFWRWFFVDFVKKVKFQRKFWFFLFFFFHVSELLKWNCFFLFTLIRLVPTCFWVIIWIFTTVKIISYFFLTIFLFCGRFTWLDVKIAKLFKSFCTFRWLETFFVGYFEIEFFIWVLLIFFKINLWWFFLLFWNRHIVPFFLLFLLGVNTIIIFWNRESLIGSATSVEMF